MARTRGRRTLPGEAGFALIEVVISAMIIVMVGGAVLGLISASTRSAAQQRARTQAYSLAQEDQSRLRSMRIASLNRLSEVRPVTLNGTEFEVESTGSFVNNTSGTTSCSENESSPDYVRIASTVRQKSGKGSPVTLQSIVSPSNGSLDPTHGNLVIEADNGQGAALSGLGVSGSGPSSFSGPTDSGGCAIFADLPAGTYTVKAGGVGLIEKEGNSFSEQQVQINGGQTQRLPLLFDKPGTLKAPFVYVYKGTTYQTVPAYVALYNAELGAAPKSFKPASETVIPTTYSVVSSLFPFRTSYSVYAGTCSAPKAKTGASETEKKEAEKAQASIAVLAGETVTSPQIQMPTLEITVTNGSTKLKGAKVVLTEEGCPSTGKYEYTTEVEGHQSATTSGLIAPAVPWSTYKICASASISGTVRHAEASGVKVEKLSSTVTQALSIPSSGSSGACS